MCYFRNMAPGWSARRAMWLFTWTALTYCETVWNSRASPLSGTSACASTASRLAPITTGCTDDLRKENASNVERYVSNICRNIPFQNIELYWKHVYEILWSFVFLSIFIFTTVISYMCNTRDIQIWMTNMQTQIVSHNYFVRIVPRQFYRIFSVLIKLYLKKKYD